ncbi:ABC transporter ATP-binding protein [Mycobacterium sp. IEC1808]|uniref:ATP-binding cassette domain-containing protein n=1 Tax=Mycobacterium sp. IEC1808 TaxID=1743230 RepID=UPI000A15B3B1|nr:ATP-binding cassette domain-containing protein [Mycobacterium sp. IEC1808]ORW92286.1 ABC transporter ATP-binding protein [Mycobacterium sp. IEC1808]
MGRPGQPVLTVRSQRSEGNFAPGRDVVVGSDLRADLRVAHPLIARAHLLLRFEGSRWVAVDNNSMNGVFLNGRRVPTVDIHDGQAINIGKPDGPRITFEVGHHQGTVGVLPPTETLQTIPPPSGPLPVRPRPPQPPPRPPGDAVQRTTAIPILRPPAATDDANPPTQMGVSGEVAEFPTTRVRAPVARIGRSLDNDIVVHDVLASRHHAFLTATPVGTEIRDANSINGTFVNGIRVGSAVLAEGDVVTIGNVDLVFSGGMLVRRQEVAARSGGLEVREVNFAINGKNLLERVSVTARPGTLTAIIGGSGAGKTTLSRLIAGYSTPTSGSVTFEGHDIHTEYASLRTRIGMVPQDDVVHRQLTVNQALGYAAELRLPPDTSKADRQQVVAQVLDELGLTRHADTRVDKLSGGQRKRASVALELLTGPSLLILDEPTSGLDPALDLQVMTMLRQLADAGRVVLVVTHSLTYLDVCDQVLLMAPGGKTAFLGAPGRIGDAMGTTNWAQIFAKVGADPDEANRRFLAQNKPPPPVESAPADLGTQARTSVRHQFSTIARRQVRLVVSDRAYFTFLALLPFVLGALSLTVPGNTGFGVAQPTSGTPDESAQILTLMSIAAVFMGTALTIRDLIGERAIFRREQAVGLSSGAYLAAKLTVFCAFAIVQAAIVTGIVLLGKGAPTQPAVLLGNPSFELFVTVAATCVASAVLGLVLSSLARSNEQIMPLLVVSLMLQLVLAGGMVPVTGRIFLDQLSWVMPSRWGYAASASTVDLRALVPGSLLAQDAHWVHTRGAWLFDMGMLVALSAVYSAIVRWRIRLTR